MPMYMKKRREREIGFAIGSHLVAPNRGFRRDLLDRQMVLGPAVERSGSTSWWTHHRNGMPD